MKLNTIKKYLNTDEIFVTCHEGMVAYEGSGCMEEAGTRYGECDIVSITPGDNCLYIEVEP